MALPRRPSAALVLVVVSPLLAGCGGARSHALPQSEQAARAKLAQLPLAFEANRGQSDPRVRFVSHSAGSTLFLTDKGTVLVLDRGDGRSSAVLRTTLVGTSTTRPRAEQRMPGIVNVLKGPRRDWHTGIPTFGQIRYQSVYPGIDELYHGRQGALEYDFQIAPGTDPGLIRISMSGARKLSIAANGDLLLHVAGGVVRQARPSAYQIIGGRRAPVETSYRVNGDRVGFDLGRYDHTRKLVIDPVLSYSSYLGGSDQDYLVKVAVGPDKKVYITGRTLSNDFPGATRDNGRTDLDAFVTKLNPDASRIYTSYVGSTGLDQAFDVAGDSSGRAYIVGDTDSASFAPFALDDCASGGTDAFIVRLDTAGALNYRSCIGGDGYDSGSGLALRESGGTPEAYIVGLTSGSVAGGFPQNNGFQQTCCTGVATWFAKVSFGSSVTIPYLTFIDGSSDDYGRAVAVDNSGNAYVAGDSVSSSIGGTSKPGASSGVFVTKVNPATTGSGSELYSTWIDGSSGDFVGNPNGDPLTGNTSTDGGIAVNSSGVAYVVGSTGSSDLPQAVTDNTFKYVSGDAGFISAISAAGSVTKTIYVDGTGATHLSDVGLQEIGGVTSIYAVGDTDGTISGLNTLSGQSCANTSTYHPDVLLVKVADGATPTGIYFTCLGGSGDDAGASIAPGPGSDATAWIVGTTTGSFPTVNPTQADPNAVTDGFVARVGLSPASIDSGPIEGAVVPNGNVTVTFSTNEPGVTFLCSAPDAGKLVAGKLGTCSGAGTTTYSGLANGEQTFEVVTVDAAGAESAPAVRKFSVNSAPPNASYVIAPNPVLVGRPASFDASGSSPTSGSIVRYEWDLDGDGSFETDGGASPTTTKTYSAAGTVHTALRVTDSNGASAVANVTLVVTDLSNLGTQVGVSINKAAKYTNNPKVKLSVVAPASATAILISNDGGFVDATTFTSAGARASATTAKPVEIPWTLDSTGPERLPKTVYLRFLVNTFASPNYTDDIILDERPPTVQQASVSPAAGAAPATAARAAKLAKWKVKVKASDTNSGVGFVQVTANKRKPGKLLKYARKLTVKSAKRPKFLRARDRAGNFSRWKKLR